MHRTHLTFVVGMTLALALTGCDESTLDAGSTASDPAAVTTEAPAAATDEATSTTTPEATEEETAATEETSDSGTSGTDDVVSYPSEVVAYADAFVAAWHAKDTGRVADLAVPEVEAATGTWSTDDGWNYDDDSSVAWVGEAGEGLHVVRYGHPVGARLEVTVEVDALGSTDGVVGADFTTGPTPGDSLTRVEDNLYNQYADAFYQALVDEDQATLERYGSEHAVRLAGEYTPETHGRVIEDHGFWSFRDQPLGLLFSYPDNTGEDIVSRYTQILDLDTALVDGGQDHGVISVNFVIDARWT
ncbi:hypothetical protein [Ornithinimicrobium tianjinense]|uniref:Lipoprotein n=1 Tax=Ornithinimicrobium tianjinense TaxID=1195761 RepID=A0A917BPY4_9MICO|nr:hypothetical protein [Ornithinimicrobium tianjinense]GGF53326.1 hypothetical protein GCM10011366_21360 [Ornithinimicrobium tianjinense]